MGAAGAVAQVPALEAPVEAPPQPSAPSSPPSGSSSRPGMPVRPSPASAAALAAAAALASSALAPPPAPDDGSPAAPTKDAAIVYFGNVGATDYLAKDQMLQGKAPWSMSAAIGARPYIEENVLGYNRARGWRVDAFMHTWNDGLEAELRALLAPLANATFGPQLLRGKEVTGSMEASIDLALQLVEGHCRTARGGRPYDRLLVLRLDSIFYRGFELDALVEGDAVYVGSWCKANSVDPLPREQWPPGVLECWRLKPYWADLEGVPDFWFAGGQAPLVKAFGHLYEDLASGAVVKGRTCGGCGHAKVWGALNGHAVKTRRYGFHQIDNDLYRDKVCGEKFQNYTGPKDAWRAHEEGYTTTTADSLCKGFVCTVCEVEKSSCAVVKPDPDDRDMHGPPPPYPLGAPKLGESKGGAL